MGGKANENEVTDVKKARPCWGRAFCNAIGSVGALGLLVLVIRIGQVKEAVRIRDRVFGPLDIVLTQ